MMQTPARPKAAAGAASTAAPPIEPAPKLADQRDALMVQIDELEAALRFMGAAHPRRDESERRLAQLKQLLLQVERAGGG